MKKKYLIIISCLLLTIVLLGCTETPAHISVSRSLDKNLNNLSYTVNKLDTIDNKTIANPDMYGTMQTSNMTFTPQQSNSTRINLMAINPQEEVSNYLLNKMISNYTCDSNGNCYLCNNSFGDGRNSNCSSCDGKIICDKFGNCTSCKNQLNLTNDGTCTNCNVKCIDGKCGDTTVSRFNTDFPILSNNTNQDNCRSNYRNPLETNQISATTDDTNAEILNNELDNAEENNTQIDKQNELSSAEKFKERFTSNYDKLENRNNQSFRNASRRNIKNNSIDDLDYLSANSEDIDPEFSYNQPKTLYYYSEESFSPNSLKYNPRFISSYNEETTSNQLNNYVVKIQKLYAITSDVLEANNELSTYKTNLLERIEEAKALNNEFQNLTFEPNIYQVQALRNYLGDIKTTNSNLRAVNGSINDQINNISTNNPTITSSIDIMNSNYLKLLNQLDIRITYYKNALATLEQLSYILEDAMVNQTQNNDTIQNETILEDSNDVINENETTNEVPKLDNNENQENNIIDNTEENNNEMQENNVLDDNEESSNENQATNNSLIDTFSDSSIKNIDTFKNQDNEIAEEENNIDNSSFEETTNNETISNNENLNNDELLNNNDNNLNENVDNNELNEDINRNGIINQNNLNTDGNIENGSNYVYDTNGNLYNANNNLLENNETNTNVDTYSYNTLIDTINRGTVDNGINTLNISAVNSNSDDNLQTLEYIEPKTAEENTSNNEESTLDSNEEESGGIRKSIASDIVCENGECEVIKNGENMEQESNELNDKQPSTLEEPSIEFISDENI